MMYVVSKETVDPSFKAIQSPKSALHCQPIMYRKNPKISDTQNICCNHPKSWARWRFRRVMHPKDAEGIANSVDPDQTAPRSSLIWVCTVCPDLSVRKLRNITVVKISRNLNLAGHHARPLRTPLSYILNQSCNTTRKWLDFGMNMWCMTICLTYVAQLLTKNFWCTVSNVSTARLSEL